MVVQVFERHPCLNVIIEILSSVCAKTSKCTTPEHIYLALGYLALYRFPIQKNGYCTKAKLHILEYERILTKYTRYVQNTRRLPGGGPAWPRGSGPGPARAPRQRHTPAPPPSPGILLYFLCIFEFISVVILFFSVWLQKRVLYDPRPFVC